MNETEFSRRLENMILTLMKDNSDIEINDKYIIIDNDKKFKVNIEITREWK